MLRTYELSHTSKTPLYEQLYEAIRQDILSGTLCGGEKLPSKRALAEHLSISKITVETAYAQLLAEGYITSRQRAGYFVEKLSPLDTAPSTPAVPLPPVAAAQPVPSAPSAPAGLFPFSVWARLIRGVLLDQPQELLCPVPNMGLPALRCAIADDLLRRRGLHAAPGQIVIGAGTEYFYDLLIQFLGRSRRYALENPGHRKLAQVCRNCGAEIVPIPMDQDGVIPDALAESCADVLHLSPSHHYPTGAVMPISRRQQLMQWLAASPDRYLIEDDYDSEFRFSGLPIPPMQSMDRTGRVIYLNTFSKTLTPALRISYMILPAPLLPRWTRVMGFYSCPVPSFEQMTLTRFVAEGYFEKHLSRTKKYYRAVRARLLQMLSQPPCSEYLTVLDAGAGLHMLLEVHTALSQQQLRQLLSRAGLHAPLLSDFYISTPAPAAARRIVLHYADLSPEALAPSLRRLCALLAEVE